MLNTAESKVGRAGLLPCRELETTRKPATTGGAADPKPRQRADDHEGSRISFGPNLISLWNPRRTRLVLSSRGYVEEPPAVLLDRATGRSGSIMVRENCTRHLLYDFLRFKNAFIAARILIFIRVVKNRDILFWILSTR